MDEDGIMRVGKAIANAGSPEFDRHAGATLDEMSKLAGEGELEAMSSCYLAHGTLHPGDRQTLLKYLHLKVLHGYIYGHRKCVHRSVGQWCAQVPDWDERLRRAITDPPRFALTARVMADEIDRIEPEREG